jgi:hypothetical protein
LTLEDGTDSLARNVGYSLRCVTSHKSEDIIHIAVAALNRAS